MCGIVGYVGREQAALSVSDEKNAFGSFVTKSNDLIQKTKYSLPRTDRLRYGDLPHSNGDKGYNARGAVLPFAFTAFQHNAAGDPAAS